MKPLVTVLSLAAILVLVAMPLSAKRPSSSSTPALERTPQQLAIEYFNRGLKYRDKARNLEQKAAGSSKSAKLLGKAEAQWNKAAEAYREALNNEPAMHEALGSLGYAYRKLGRYEESLRAYDRALELDPQYVEAIEYRAEAYLGLNRVEDAKAAYMELFRLDRAVADTLMEAMAGWLEGQGSASEAMAAEQLEAFATWLEERGEIASQTAMLLQAERRGW